MVLRACDDSMLSKYFLSRTPQRTKPKYYNTAGVLRQIQFQSINVEQREA